jgi:aminoglycoside 3-N-acetyltransferase I
MIERLGEGDLAAMKQVNQLFLEVFADEAYHGPGPGDAHLQRLLADHKFIALAAWVDGEMVGALAAYELVKYEAERSEIYIYDLAVREEHRRRGVATALIEALSPIAREKGAWVIYVQADRPTPRPSRSTTSWAFGKKCSTSISSLETPSAGWPSAPLSASVRLCGTCSSKPPCRAS